ncbi:MAG: MetS family NSS transporter small subunit [Lachnospirales bacterium]
MELQAVIFMCIGLCITWGGLGAALYRQAKHSESQKSK